MAESRMRELERRAAEGDEEAGRRLLVERGRLVGAHPRIVEAWNELPTVADERAALKALREGMPPPRTPGADIRPLQRFVGGAGRRWLRERAVRVLDLAYNGKWDGVLHEVRAMQMSSQTCPTCYGRRQRWVEVGEGELGLGLSRREHVDCSTCEATGQVVPEDDAWAKFAKTCLGILEEIGVDIARPEE